MESLLQYRQLSQEVKQLRDDLIRGLLSKMEAGEMAVKHYVNSLSQDEQMFLLDFSTEELRGKLAAVIEESSGIPISKRYQPVLIPSQLPEGIKKQLEAYHNRVKVRYVRLLHNGHSREIKYVRRRMSDPIRLAKFLNEQGVEMWGSMTNTHLTRFFQENPSLRVEKLHSFINFIEKKKRFNDGRGRGRRGRGQMSAADPFPEVIEPSVLSELIRARRDELNDIEYLAFWLVARMGMVARKAYELSLDNIAKNDSGYTVIHPNSIWVTVPKVIASLFEQEAKRLDPKWPNGLSEGKDKKYLFHDVLTYRQFTEDVLQHNSVLLRRSAIFSAMQRGHMDRVTIHQTMGVSMPTIVTLENLLSVDLHRTLDRKMVKQRNEYILGESNG